MAIANEMWWWGFFIMTGEPKRKIALARKLRKAMTEPEYLLWQRLKVRASGVVFKRQHPIGPYILDFYCYQAKLAIEVDGALHGEEVAFARDTRRDAYLLGEGIETFRISAADIYRSADDVADSIRLKVDEILCGKK